MQGRVFFVTSLRILYCGGIDYVDLRIFRRIVNLFQHAFFQKTPNTKYFKKQNKNTIIFNKIILNSVILK